MPSYTEQSLYAVKELVKLVGRAAVSEYHGLLAWRRQFHLALQPTGVTAFSKSRSGTWRPFTGRTVWSERSCREINMRNRSRGIGGKLMSEPAITFGQIDQKRNQAFDLFSFTSFLTSSLLCVLSHAT